jgi:hypothetical protein
MDSTMIMQAVRSLEVGGQARFRVAEAHGFPISDRIGKISYSVWGRLQRTSGNHGDIIFPAILVDDEKPSQSSNDTRRSKHGKEITLSLDLARLMSAVERGRGRLKAIKAENTRPRLPDSQ